MLKQVGATAAIVLGSFVGISVLSVAEGESLAAVIASLLLFSATPIVGGTWTLLHVRRRAHALAEDADRAWEAELLRLAEERGGSVTVAEVVAATGLEAVRAEAVLDRLCTKALAEHRVADEGTIVYRFVPRLTAAAKRSSRGVLE